MKLLAFLLILYCVACFFSPDSSSTTTYCEVDEDTDEDDGLFNRIYADNTYRTKGIFDSTYVYSNNMTSYVDMFDVEHRSNGEKVLPDGRVYDKDGNFTAREVDIWGITYRYDN